MSIDMTRQRFVKAALAALATLVALVASVTAGAPPAAQAADDLKAFPAAEPGQGRHVLRLPAQDDESALRVELQIGRTVEVDAANRYFFAGRLEAQTIAGWGYTRYTLAALGPMAGTLMAVDPKAPKVARFITLAGEPGLLRYNSRLPLVVYLPEGVELRYRLWRAEPASKPVDRG